LNQFKIGIAILQSLSKPQHDKVDWSGKKSDFSTLKKSKKLNGVIKPLYPSTNPEILVKIGPLACEPPGLRSRPLKNKD